MIAEFTVRQDQGHPSGFDLGDMLWHGDLGEANSSGQTPDQGMMIYISTTQLLDCLSELLRGQVKATTFTGTDTSFELTFRATRRGVSITARSGPVAVVTPAELAQTVLAAAERLARNHLDSLPSDGVRDDYLAALGDFRLVASKY
ncbi:hypothetical protein [Streptomyces sp. KS 21]|uniref:hypothetical protein n=1 Tax=Streptomyces sp. KS 21 TaxID=2485150 RepID=UPI0010624771|nr:hypothetical protein [Streptomyces sp. KS 21]TDU76123.1 hypothetical protein EDD91_2829 [Streptomyces sp. KS 21]